MFHFKCTGRDYSWIIIASAYAPDLDVFSNAVFGRLGMPVYGTAGATSLKEKINRNEQ